MRNIVIGLVVGVLIAGTLTFRSSAASDVERQAQDRTEIEALMWKYTRSLDTQDVEGYASVYTADGQFSVNGKWLIKTRNVTPQD